MVKDLGLRIEGCGEVEGREVRVEGQGLRVEGIWFRS